MSNRHQNSNQAESEKQAALYNHMQQILQLLVLFRLPWIWATSGQLFFFMQSNRLRLSQSQTSKKSFLALMHFQSQSHVLPVLKSALLDQAKESKVHVTWKAWFHLVWFIHLEARYVCLTNIQNQSPWSFRRNMQLDMWWLSQHWTFCWVNRSQANILCK